MVVGCWRSSMDSSKLGKVAMGTCGWSDQTLLKCGRFYPASVRTPEARLRHYSSHFPCVEVDTSTYAIPSSAMVQRWMNCVPKGFIFHFKAFGLFCSKSCPIAAIPSSVRTKLPLPCLSKDYVSLTSLHCSLRDELWQVFNGSLQPAYDAGSLGVVVFQFHLSFKPSNENRLHVEWCRSNLDPHYSMAVEFRCRDWFTGEHRQATLGWLKEKRLALVAADELQHETFQKDRNQTGLAEGQVRTTLPVAWSLTVPDFIYIRVHRREGTQRLLSEDELNVWENRLNSCALREELKGPIFFMWGTDWEDQPIMNAKNLSQKLGGMVFDWKNAQKESGPQNRLLFFLTSHKAPSTDRSGGDLKSKQLSSGSHKCEENKEKFKTCNAENSGIKLCIDEVVTPPSYRTEKPELKQEKSAVRVLDSSVKHPRKKLKSSKRQDGSSPGQCMLSIASYFNPLDSGCKD